MEKKLHTFLALIIALCITTGATAQDTTEKPEKAKVQEQDRKGKQKAKKQKERLAKRTMRSISSIELTEDQQKQLASLIDENFDTVQAMQKKIDGIISKDQRKPLNAAAKKARDAGKPWTEAMKAAHKEIGLSEEDSNTVQTLNQERNALFEKIKKEIVATFSDDQKKAMKAVQSKKGKRGQGKNGKSGKSGKGKKSKTEKSSDSES